MKLQKVHKLQNEIFENFFGLIWRYACYISLLYLFLYVYIKYLEMSVSVQEVHFLRLCITNMTLTLQFIIRY